MALTDERPIVVGIGEVLLDYHDNGTIKLGGAPLIFAYHAAKSHCRSLIISAIGNDSNGNLIKTRVEEKGVIAVFNTVDNKPTGTAVVKDFNNKPKYNIVENAAWVEITNPKKLENIKGLEEFETLKELARKTKAVYFGTLASYYSELYKGTSKQTIDAFIKEMDNCTNLDHITRYKIFDVNLRGDSDKLTSELIRDYIKICNVLKADEEEIKIVGGYYDIAIEDSDTIGKTLMERFSNLKILILTKGEKGSTVFWRDKKDEEDKDEEDKDEEDKKEENNMIFSQSIHISVEPQHSVGPGDAMVGAFIGELLYGRTESQAHLLAAQRADKVCKDKDRNSMPDIPDVDFFFSYSRKDNAIVNMFFHKFTDNKKHTVFKDRPTLVPGNISWNVIADKIANCRVFVYFSSKSAKRSKNVLREINIAIGKKKDIAIIKLDNSPYHKKVRGDLKPIQYGEFYLYEQLLIGNSEYDILNELDKVSNEIMGFYENRQNIDSTNV